MNTPSKFDVELYGANLYVMSVSMVWNQTFESEDTPAHVQEHLLVGRIRDGDEHAFTAIVAQYLDTVTRFAFYIVQSHDVAEDIAQNVFVALWEHRDTLGDIRSLKSYLLRAAHNRAINDQRAAGVRERYQTHLRTELELGGLLDDPPSADENEWPLTDSLVQTAVDRLSERHRLALRLRILDEMTNPEIAGILGISTEAAQRLISRAMANLRKFLRPSE